MAELIGKIVQGTQLVGKISSLHGGVTAGELAAGLAGKADKTYVDAQDATKANKAQEEWITPTLLNGWTVYTGEVFQYRKNQFNRIEFRGRLDGSARTSNSYMTLPAGYRPSKRINISFWNTGYLAFNYSGDCQIAYNSPSWGSFDNISFSLEA